MSSDIFRKKSIEKIKSPDNLQEYIKVINPSLWIIFIATILLLAGAFVWGTFGKIDDKLQITAVSQNSIVTCSYNESIKTGMKAVINENEGTVSTISNNGITITFNDTIPNGVYSGYIVLGQISPISFVFN